jgi:4-carboxymuconolactone decarboxylase
MPRIPAVTREAIREDLRGVFDEINAGPGGIGTGPMSVLKHSPEMAKRAIPLFEYVRNESTVPLPIRELAMLTTARAKDCPYIWNRHVTLARESGLSSDLIDALRDRKPLPPMSELEKAVIDMGLIRTDLTIIPYKPYIYSLIKICGFLYSCVCTVHVKSTRKNVC